MGAIVLYDFPFVDLDGLLIVFERNSGSFVELDGSAAFAWRSLEKKARHDLECLTAILEAHYDCPTGQARDTAMEIALLFIKSKIAKDCDPLITPYKLTSFG